MKQNILKKLMLIAVLLTGVNAFAHDFVDGGIYYNITSFSDLTVEVTYRGDSYNSYDYEYSGRVTMPETVTYNSNTYSVTSIGSSAFRDCSDLTSITIPNSVTSIGNYAFYGCAGLTSVNISDLEAWCKIDFSSSNSNPLYYAKNLYLNGELLTNIEIPNSITEIKQYAFEGCSGLKSVTIGNRVTSIGKSAFYGCSGLTSVTIPESVTSIGKSAFMNCSGLRSVVFNAENCTTMGGSSYPVFSGCTNLTSITIGDKVKNIPNYAFSGCSGLESIIVESGNTVYDSRNNCNAIIATLTNTLITGCKNTTIGNSVTSIGDGAFSNCSGLTSVVFNAENCTTMGGSSYPVFSGCTNLTSITSEIK